MQYWFVLQSLLVLVYAHPRDINIQDECELLSCVGEEYSCVNGKCFCAPNYVPSLSQTSCVRCPGLGQTCFSVCCNRDANTSLQCWNGICQNCYDAYGTWVCRFDSRDNMDQILLVTVSQVAMATALVLGIIATFVLLCKLCATTNIRPNNQSCDGTRLSIGSLQLYVEERLRDAPPSYTRAGPATSSIAPTPFFVNAGFIHDSSVPPPPYTPSKSEEQTNLAVHI